MLVIRLVPWGGAPREPAPATGARASGFGGRCAGRVGAGRRLGGAVGAGGVVVEGLPVPGLRPAHHRGHRPPRDMAGGRARVGRGPPTLARRVLGAPAAAQAGAGGADRWRRRSARRWRTAPGSDGCAARRETA